jgi:hypothetical protein
VCHFAPRRDPTPPVGDSVRLAQGSFMALGRGAGTVSDAPPSGGPPPLPTYLRRTQ